MNTHISRPFAVDVTYFATYLIRGEARPMHESLRANANRGMAPATLYIVPSTFY